MWVAASTRTLTPSSADVQNAWNFTYTSHTFMAWWLEQRENITFNLICLKIFCIQRKPLHAPPHRCNRVEKFIAVRNEERRIFLNIFKPLGLVLEKLRE
jgi:hypothetical protein